MTTVTNSMTRGFHNIIVWHLARCWSLEQCIDQINEMLRVFFVNIAPQSRSKLDEVKVYARRARHFHVQKLLALLSVAILLAFSINSPYQAVFQYNAAHSEPHEALLRKRLLVTRVVAH